MMPWRGCLAPEYESQVGWCVGAGRHGRVRMATNVARCEAHGEATRLTCVDCARAICPRCMLRTEVGLKCQGCAQPAAVPLNARLRAGRAPLALGLAGLATVLVAVLLFVLRSSGPEEPERRALPPVGAWSNLPDLATVRGTASAVVLGDGDVLVAGGGVSAIALAAAEVFNPGTGQSTTVASLNQARRGHRAVVLKDGRVLATGGIAEGALLASAEVYDPVRRAWSPTAPMSTPRLGHSLSLLGDGRVIAIGGTVPAGDAAAAAEAIRPDASAEIYDPAKGTWAPAASMGSPRFEHTSTPLADGRVLIAGGLGPGGDGLRPLQSVEVYDPAANAFVRSTDLNEGRTNHAAAVLADGSVLVVGGAGGTSGDVSLSSAEVFDPRQGSWTAVSRLAESRTGQTATALADGGVLVAGGESVSRGTRRSLSSAEVFDPSARTWRSAGSMSCPRSEHEAVRLVDGSVLVIAGDAAFPGKAPIAQSCVGRFQP